MNKNSHDTPEHKRRQNLQAGEGRIDSVFISHGLPILRTQGETAKIMGCTRARVQQLERAALFKLKQGLRDLYEQYRDNGQ